MHETDLHKEYKKLNCSYKKIHHNLRLGIKDDYFCSMIVRQTEAPNKLFQTSPVKPNRETNQKSNEDVIDIEKQCPRSGPLINKEFYCRQYGMESVASAPTVAPSNKRTFDNINSNKNGKSFRSIGYSDYLST